VVPRGDEADLEAGTIEELQEKLAAGHRTERRQGRRTTARPRRGGRRR
jgi:hypothetical protein